MKSAITVSLVPEARGGPFVYWDDLEAAFRSAAELGFDGIEIFPATPEGAAPELVRPLMEKYGLTVAALGTGGGWVAHKWHFGSPDPAIRSRARAFVRGIIEAAAALGAKAIVGSMQGKPEPGVSREQGIAWLAEALEELGAVAEGLGQPLLYEPLNRYESQLFNQLGETVTFLGTLRTKNVRILADMFHMNIEEVSVPLAIRAAAGSIGHFHFADSNRHAIGFGHTDVAPITEALKDSGYDGYVSGEVLPLPDAESAAAQTLRAYRRFILGITNGE
jgi:sugar phosphate isomerase/epimerase